MNISNKRSNNVPEIITEKTNNNLNATNELRPEYKQSRSSKSKMTTGNLVLTGMFTALLCVLAQISIPTQPIPFTLALFAIFLIGAMLPPRLAFLSVLTYILLGAFGLPVFANMKGGFQVITGVTGGFIMAYPFMAYFTAMFYKYSRKYKTPALICGMLVSLSFCYLMGSMWFTITSGSSFYHALTLCVFPFILFDILKILLAATIGGILRGTLWKMHGAH